jgi:predicted butyrate kinase (DUF1464 family)
MVRVAGTDPGTSSLDILVLEDGAVADQCRFPPAELQADPALPVRWLANRGPLDLVAGPSGYGLPLVRADACTDRDLALLSLLRPDDTGRGGQGVLGFSAVVRAFRSSGLPVVFLPGVIHLPTVPAHRKINRIDLGTPDKLCVAALAAARCTSESGFRGCVVELGTAFTACLVLDGGRVVDGVGGSAGPCGWASPGAWDGEAAYLLSPLAKRDLFAGGAGSVGDRSEGCAWLREALVKTVAGLRTVTAFERVVLSGRLLETEPGLVNAVEADLGAFGKVTRLESLPEAWVKHAAQGAALIADGLAGGSHGGFVKRLALCQAAGTVLDWLRHPRAAEARALFL